MKALAYKGLLTAYVTKRDRFGNVYDAFQYIDFKTGKKINAKDCGGLSNIQAIHSYLTANDIKSAILFRTEEFSKKGFERLIAYWFFLGSNPKVLAEYIEKMIRR